MFGAFLFIALVLVVCLPLYWASGAHAHAKPRYFLVAGIGSATLGYVIQSELVGLQGLLATTPLELNGVDHAGHLIGTLCVALAGAFFSAAVTNRAKFAHDESRASLSEEIAEREALLEGLLEKLSGVYASESSDPGDMAIKRYAVRKLFDSSLRTMETLRKRRGSLDGLSPEP